MSQALPVSEAVVDAIARCAQVLDEPERLKEEVAQLRELQGDTVSFAVALFELERARRGDPEARESIQTVAQLLLAFWQDKRGDSLASQHPALELLWADATALLISFEVRRFSRALTQCWESREDAEALSAAIAELKPDDNRRVEFARCLYHLELARLGRPQSRAEFARRAGLLQEAYLDERVARELVGDDSGLAHLWKELVPYLDEFFEMLEEQQAKASAAAQPVASAPQPEVTAPMPPPESRAVATEPREAAEAPTPPPAERHAATEPRKAAEAPTPPPEARPDVTEPVEAAVPRTPPADYQSAERVPIHRAPIEPEEVAVEATPPEPPPEELPTQRPTKADELLKAHLDAPEDEWVVPSDQRPTERPHPAARDNIATDQVPALVRAGLPGDTTPQASPSVDVALDSTLPPSRQMGNVSGVFDLWLTTQEPAEAKAKPDATDDIEVVEPEPTAPPPRPPDDSQELELADVVETIPPSRPPPPPDTTPVPVPAPKRRVSGSGIIDLQAAVKASRTGEFAKPPPPEPEYRPDEATLAFWRFSEQALGLLPPTDGPRPEARVLSGEGRGERKKLTQYTDEALRRFESVPEARTFACLLRLYLAGQMKEKSLFGGVNAKRKEAFRSALQLLSGAPLAAGHAAVWFELDGKQTVDGLLSALDTVSEFLVFCAQSGLDPLDPTSAEQFLP